MPQGFATTRHPSRCLLPAWLLAACLAILALAALGGALAGHPHPGGDAGPFVSADASIPDEVGPAAQPAPALSSLAHPADTHCALACCEGEDLVHGRAHAGAATACRASSTAGAATAAPRTALRRQYRGRAPPSRA